MNKRTSKYSKGIARRIEKCQGDLRGIAIIVEEVFDDGRNDAFEKMANFIQRFDLYREVKR